MSLIRLKTPTRTLPGFLPALVTFLLTCWGAIHADNFKYYFVATQSGLMLRTAPNTNAKKLAVIPFGTRVSAIGNELEGDPVTVGNITEYWLKVTYGKTSGYAFKGFLVPFPPLQMSDTPMNENRITDHFAKHAKFISKESEKGPCQMDDMDCPIQDKYERETRYYQIKGSDMTFRIHHWMRYEGSMREIDFDRLELYEAFLILKNGLPYLEKVSYTEKFPAVPGPGGNNLGHQVEFVNGGMTVNCWRSDVCQNIRIEPSGPTLSIKISGVGP